MKSKLTILFCTLVTVTLHAQLAINGAYIKIANDATLVVNGNTISRTGGGIISEGANNRLVWKVGSNTSLLTAPFATTSYFIPVNIQLATGASSDGALVLATYAGPTWQNSSYLPPTVTNVNYNGTDNSFKMVDRFWRVQPQGYTLPPGLAQLSLYYNAAELASPNTISEPALIAQRWNGNSNRWDDYFPTTVANTVGHFITASNVPANQVFSWWAAVDGSFPLPATLLGFAAENQPTQVLARWQTASEADLRNFEVQRSPNGTSFNTIGTVAAAGQSNHLISYSLPDWQPLDGISYYRLRINQNNGTARFSQIVAINRSALKEIRIFPNPVYDNLYVQLPATMQSPKNILQLYDATGKRLMEKSAANPIETFFLGNLPKGMYELKLIADDEVRTYPVIKK